MTRTDKIYTRRGDQGMTQLGDGSHAAKHEHRFEVLGALDETNAALGLALSVSEKGGCYDLLIAIQHDLFELGAELAAPGRPPRKTGLTEDRITWLENHLDAVNEKLSPLTSFILPGGSEASARLHFARTVCRRAERYLSRLIAEQEKEHLKDRPLLLKYLNRLSDLLFVLAREANDFGKSDQLWAPSKDKTL